MSFNFEKMNKLPREAQFFDVNKLWYFFNGWLVRILYPTPITPNQITFLSLVLGLLSAGFYVSGKTDALAWGAGFLYGKVILDNVDGNLARARGASSRWRRSTRWPRPWPSTNRPASPRAGRAASAGASRRPSTLVPRTSNVANSNTGPGPARPPYRHLRGLW